ncbi:MAG: hypothetical protein JHC31_14175 [Sulfurihydrogenibium sp.]|jgi:hypothetical protein|nr:hypothetical protein [Sulfurihydrogenibium sp.]
METKVVRIEAKVRKGRKERIKKKKCALVTFDQNEILALGMVGCDIEIMKHLGYIYLECYRNGNVLTDGYSIPVNSNVEDFDWCRVIIVPANSEIYNPDKYSLLAKDNEYAMYVVNHNDPIYLKHNKEHVWIHSDCQKFIFIFDSEKPFSSDTLKLIEKILRERKKKVAYPGGRFDVELLDDVDVYVGEKPLMMAIENAEIVSVLDMDALEERLIAIKGNKVYLEIDKQYAEDRVFDCDLNSIDALNILKNDEDSKIVEIPNLDIDIKIREAVIDAESVLIDDSKTEEKTYKLRELLRKLNNKD